MHVPAFRYLTDNVKASDFVLPVCIPEMNNESQPKFLSDISKKFTKNMIPFLLQDYKESKPMFLTKDDDKYIKAFSLEDYYINSLRAFCMITGLDKEDSNNNNVDKPAYGKYQMRFIDAKQKIEKEI